MSQQALFIMLIDDDPDDRFLFKEALRELNAAIKYIPIGNAIEALEYLNDGVSPHPDFIFLDMNMPRMNGLECLAELKKSKTLNHIPVAIYSTSRNEEHERQAEELGAVSFIQKSVRFDDIVKEIEQAITAVK